MDFTSGYDESEMPRQGSFELDELQSTTAEAIVALGRVYIFTAPCFSAVQTAIKACTKENSKIL